MGKEIATHSSVLAWRVPWTEEPGGLQSMGSQRVGYDFKTTHRTADSRDEWIGLEWGRGREMERI